MKTKSLVCAALAAVCGLCGCHHFGPCEKPPAIPREQGLYRCQIHRGGGVRERPDNALETCLWCWGHGMTPEADARLTKDGVAIALHDGNLARVGRGIAPAFAKRPVSEMNWSELCDVDVGSYLDPAYAATRIATMESIFAAMKGRPERLLYVDEKGAPPELIAELAERFGVISQVYYCSPNWRLIPRWRKVAPKGRSMVWLGGWARDNSSNEVARCEKFVQQQLDEMEAIGFDGIDQVQLHVRTDLAKDDPFCPSTPFMKRAIARMHRYGVTVNTVTWTEGENESVYWRLWDLGFDHFTTDYPQTLFKVVDAIRAGATSPFAAKPALAHEDEVYGALYGCIEGRFRLWPGLAPHETASDPGRYVFDTRCKVWRRRDVTCPEVVMLKPREVRSDALVVFMPGGGYDSHHMGHLVKDVKPILDSGRRVAVLHYRVPRRDGRAIYAAPREDAARAIRLLKANAAKYGYSPKKIGAIGFSAGGHLAAISATSSLDALYPRIDAADDLPANLAFAIPVYPAYVADDGATDANKNRGDGARLLPEFKFDAQTPPMFLLHGDDDYYSSMASVLLYAELHKRKIPAQMFVFAHASHGLSDRVNARGWQLRIVDWLKEMGW